MGRDAITTPRPRRWGKSLNLNMLKTFASITVDDSGKIITPNKNKVIFVGGEFTTHDGSKKV